MSRRRLSDEERVLWKGITRSIAPLRNSRDAMPDNAEPPAARPAVKARPKLPPKPASKVKAKSAAAAIKPVAPPAVPKPAPPLAPLGRRVRQQLARGSRAIDGRLDLHGMTQVQAHDALLGFLGAMQARGAKVVLIITGKGAGGGDPYGERGVLKRQAPLWLRLPEFRRHIVGFEAAGIGHGGEGALYVTLRRAREP